VYTKPRCEKKVAELLTKKKIINYCPLNKVRKQGFDIQKWAFEPLFTSYLFVRVTKEQHAAIRQISGVINFLYWMGEPAIIRDVEIDMIQRFLNEHKNIKIERSKVNIHDTVRITNGSILDLDGQNAIKTVKLVLPSFGFTMSAQLETTNVKLVTPPTPRSSFEFDYKMQ
jgi:transcription antitermination factor NusG